MLALDAKSADALMVLEEAWKKENHDEIEKQLSERELSRHPGLALVQTATRSICSPGNRDSGRSSKLSPGNSGESKTQSFQALTLSNGINFGKHSGSAATTSTSSTGSELTSLLKQTVSGGLMSALGGSFGFGSITGIGSIFSSISSLFGGGGKKTLPALVDFKLPNAQNSTVYLGAKGSTVYQGSMTKRKAHRR